LTKEFTHQGISLRFGAHLWQQAKSSRRKFSEERLDTFGGQVFKLATDQQRLVFLDALEGTEELRQARPRGIELDFNRVKGWQ